MIISGVFFGGAPSKVIKAIVTSDITACATKQIIDEYIEIIDEMISRKQGNIDKNLLYPFINVLEIVETKSHIKISRDSDDDNKSLNVQKMQMLCIL